MNLQCLNVLRGWSIVRLGDVGNQWRPGPMEGPNDLSHMDTQSALRLSMGPVRLQVQARRRDLWLSPGARSVEIIGA
jgi:hypothetical protein